tara:strand:- start:2169 stop:2606 length:438 start_codon:yes stop_codon:yes gene_type:complete
LSKLSTVPQQTEFLEELHDHRKKIEFAAENLAKNTSEEHQRMDSVNRVSGEMIKVCRKIMSMEGKTNHFTGGLGNQPAFHKHQWLRIRTWNWLTKTNNRISSYSERVDSMEQASHFIWEKIAISPVSFCKFQSCYVAIFRCTAFI